MTKPQRSVRGRKVADPLHGRTLVRKLSPKMMQALQQEFRENESLLPIFNDPPAMAIRGPDDVYELCQGIRHSKREHFLILLLNTRHGLMQAELISIGSLNASIVHPRDVFRPAIIFSAAYIVLVHNHPSGDPSPSDEDIQITERLGYIGEMVGIPVMDHVIIGADSAVSMRALGALDEKSEKGSPALRSLRAALGTQR